jgi:hypothetical protein
MPMTGGALNVAGWSTNDGGALTPRADTINGIPTIVQSFKPFQFLI